MKKESIKSDTTRIQKIVLSCSGIFTILFSLSYIFIVIFRGRLLVSPIRFILFTLIIFLSIWFLLKILFYSVTATAKGLETDNIIGIKKKFHWEDIIEVRRPRFGFPLLFTYVISNNEDRIVLVKNKQNYKELIQYIKKKATNISVFKP